MREDTPPGPGSEPPAPFPYMRWAKRRLEPPHPGSLGLSGALPPGPDFPAPAPGPCGRAAAEETRFREAVARREGLPPECVLPTLGTSHANFLIYLAFARGGGVAAEEPAYGALHASAGLVGAELETFGRDEAEGWRIDPDDLGRAARPGTRLLVVSDLHNPSGAALHPEDLDRLLGRARSVGGFLLVDEVYREFDPARRPTAALRDACVLATSSLTKVHGLGDLRAGWILGDPALIRRLDEVNDLVAPRLAAPALSRACDWLPHADALAARARALAAERIEQVDAFVRGRRDLAWTRPAGGLTGFLRLADGVDGDAVADRLREREGVPVVPGSFFQRPGWLRLSFGIPQAALAASLEALGRVLDAVSG